jgi:hypothetical protein
MGDLSGMTGAAEAIGIPLGIIFALGVAVAGALARPFGLVCILAGVTGLFNLSLLWYFSSDQTWTWRQGTPILAITLALVGIFIAWMRRAEIKL